MSDPCAGANRKLWDEWTELHIQTGTEYRALVEKLKAGGSTLDEDEQVELGAVAGKTLLHLQCHLGLGTLSLARSGAIVTGVDWTERAIEYARSLGQTLGIAAEFICSDVYDLPAALDRQFDLVYASGGVLAWLPDLKRWAEIVAYFLKPGGTFYMRDMHPIRHLLLPPRLDAFGAPIEHGYFKREPTCVHERGSFAVPDAPSVHMAHYWTHNLGEILTALCEVGLRLEYLHEFPKVAENCCTYEETATGETTRRLINNVLVPRAFSVRCQRMGNG